VALKKSDLYASIWASCDELRGGMDASQYKALVVDDKWMARLSATVQGELDRASQTLTSRIRELAERYATRLPALVAEVEALAMRVEEHLRRMGASWK